MAAHKRGLTPVCVCVCVLQPEPRVTGVSRPPLRKRERVQKSMGHKVPWKTGVPICRPVTSRPLILPQNEGRLSPCTLATTHLTAFILNFYLPLTSRPMKWRTLSQRHTSGPKIAEGLKKGLLGGLQKSPGKYPEKKVKNTQKRSGNGYFRNIHST